MSQSVYNVNLENIKTFLHHHLVTNVQMNMPLDQVSNNMYYGILESIGKLRIVNVDRVHTSAKKGLWKDSLPAAYTPFIGVRRGRKCLASGPRGEVRL